MNACLAKVDDQLSSAEWDLRKHFFYFSYGCPGLVHSLLQPHTDMEVPPLLVLNDNTVCAREKMRV